MADSKKYNGSTWEHSLRKLTTATDTLTTLPVDLYADGNNATVGITGNTVQNGTPTPDSPIMPQCTGEKTGNLFDGQLQQGYYTYHNGLYVLADAYVCTHLIPCTDNTTYTFRCINTGGGSKNYGYVFFDSSQNRIGDDYINAFTEGDVVTHTATTPQNTAFLAINIAYGRRQANVIRPSDITDFMLNTGSTTLPYEPYGYKIPISSANTTTPVYLGEVETTRNIRKLVLDGTENWTYRSGDPANVFFMYLPTAKTGEVAMSNAYPYYSGTDFVDMNDKEFAIIRSNLAIRNSDYQYESRFKAYLAAQYAAGTPVTVWYVLATPETGIVNEPLMKIGDYADEVSGITVPTITGADSFDVETTLKPSEVELTYTGWHDATVQEWDGSQWNE